MLQAVGLGDRMRHKPTQMSGGQQQRVGIARAFVAKPRIVFADEPTGNLDSKTTLDVMEMMIRMARENNLTLVIVTHEAEIASYADTIYSMKDGRITKVAKENVHKKTEQENITQRIEEIKKEVQENL
jgi:putative ABC transport system ATP-binding protein